MLLMFIIIIIVSRQYLCISYVAALLAIYARCTCNNLPMLKRDGIIDKRFGWNEKSFQCYYVRLDPYIMDIGRVGPY